jgi:glycosyltransferase involved in cell wall biosynthesis
MLSTPNGRGLDCPPAPFHGINRPSLSVVIPTWNEAKWLPRILDQLIRLPSAEIIVADNHSVDQTIALAKQYYCPVVKGGRPAEARNRGAAKTSGEILIFVDADVVIDCSVLEYAARQFEEDPELVALHFPIHPFARSLFIRACYVAMRWYFYILSKMRIAQGIGNFLAVRRSTFLSLGGFDARLGAGEDADLLRRLGRRGRVRFDTTHVVGVSARRFEIENSTIFALKTFMWASLRLLDLPISLFSYKWQPYPDHLAEAEEGLYIDYLNKARGSERG